MGNKVCPCELGGSWQQKLCILGQFWPIMQVTCVSERFMVALPSLASFSHARIFSPTPFSSFPKGRHFDVPAGGLMPS